MQAAKAIVASVLMNVAIVGINQVYDKKLDRVRVLLSFPLFSFWRCSSGVHCAATKSLNYLVQVFIDSRHKQNERTQTKIVQVNKPYLPMANGAFSSDTALAVIAVCTTCSLILGERRFYFATKLSTVRQNNEQENVF